MRKTYGFLSRFSHPNIEGIAYTIDEDDQGGGNVLCTFRAGGTREPNRLLMFGGMAAGTTGTASILVVEALAGHLPAELSPILMRARAVVMDLTKHGLVKVAEQSGMQADMEDQLALLPIRSTCPSAVRFAHNEARRDLPVREAVSDGVRRPAAPGRSADESRLCNASRCRERQAALCRPFP